MGAHAVREGFDEDRPTAGAGVLNCPLSDCVTCDDVIAIHAHGGNAKALAAVGEWNARLAGYGLRDSELVVLHKEHHWCVVHRSEHECLIDVALRCGAVTEVAYGCAVALWVTATHETIAVECHGIARRVQSVGANHERIQVEVVVLGVPSAVLEAAENSQNLNQVNIARKGDAMFTVAREHKVGVT